MAWTDDLKILLEETGGRLGTGIGDVVNSGAVQAIPAPIRDTTGSGADLAMRALNIGQDVRKFGTGAILAAGNEALGMLPGQELGILPGALKPQFIPEQSAALHEGFAGYGPGPRAVYEQRASQEPMAFQFAAELAGDPFNYAGGIARKGGQAARELANVSLLTDQKLVGMGPRGWNAYARGLETLNAANDLPGKVLLPPIQAGVRSVGRGVSRFKPNALLTSERQVLENTESQIDNLLIAKRSKGGTRKPVTQLNIEPVQSNPIPPVPPSAALHPARSAPRSLYGQMIEGWRNLRAGQPLGIANIDRSGQTPIWREPKDVRLKQEHVDDMARIGAGIMQTVSDENGLFPQLIRASTGMREIQEQIVGKYGTGIQPFLPAIYKQMRIQLERDGYDADKLMPSSRFLLPWGWAPGVVGTKRLQGIEDAVKAGKMTRQEAMTLISTPGSARGSMSKGSPEVVEAAAAMGASYLTLGRQADDAIYTQFRPGGMYFPDSPAPNQVALVPKAIKEGMFAGEAGPLKIDLSDAAEAIGVSQPFGTQREMWNQMMRHTFGGDLADDELDTLADMATDLAYDAYVNAANDFSGGTQGATKLAQSLNDAGTEIDYLKMRGKTSEKIADQFRKRGALSTEPRHIGSPESQALIRSHDIPEGGSIGFDAKHGRALQGDIWRAQAEKELGRPLTVEDVAADVHRFRATRGRQVTDEMAEEWLNARGLDPIIENPKGGILPNLTQLVSHYVEGAPLRVGMADAATWYPRVAEEIERIVGRGNYEDASFLLDAIGITSTATEVSANAEFALRALAEWKFGSDETLRTKFGLTGVDFDAIRNAELVAGKKGEPYNPVSALSADMQKNQRVKLVKAMNEYVARRGDPTRMPQAIQGGAKTHNYAGSFLVNIWRDQIDKAVVGMGNTKVSRDLKKAFNDALTIYTVDRHDARISNLATAVNPIEEFLLRERGLVGAKVAGLSGEEAQAAGWYWVRDRQGFMREVRAESDMMHALRQAIRNTYENVPNPQGTWDEIAAKLGAETGHEGEELLADVYDLVRQDLFYSYLKKSFDNPQVQAALRKAGIPDTLAEAHGDMLSVVTRGAIGVAPEERPHPLKVYHGSPKKGLTRLTTDPPERQYDDLASSRLGVFFTPDRREAEGYAGTRGQVYTTDLDLKNPDHMDYETFYSQYVGRDQDRMENVKNLRQWLLDHGHDGLIVEMDGKPREIISLNDIDVNLGIIRKPSGVTPADWADPLAANPAMDMLRKTEQILAGMVDGSTYGDTLGWNGSTWEVSKPTSGFAVALTSAGRAVNPRKAKTALKQINRWIASPAIADLFDPVTNYGNEDHLFFGLFPMDEVGGPASFDLTTIVPDRETAIALGRRMNQQSVYDFATGDLIPTGGSGQPVVASTAKVQEILDAAHGPRATRPKPSLEEARRRGVTLAEHDTVNAYSLFRRKVWKPVMDAFAEASLLGGTQASGVGIDDLNLPEWPDRAAAVQMKYDPALTLQQNQLIQTKLKDGRTYQQFLDTETLRASRDMEAIKTAGLQWKAWDSLDNKLKAAGGDAKLEKVIRAWDKEGIDLLYAQEPDVVAGRLLKDQMRSDAGIVAPRPTTYDLMKAAWGEQALASIKYHTGNLLGAWTQNALAGVYEAFTPKDIWSAFKAIRAGTNSITREEALASLKGTQIARQWGLERMPVEVMRGGVRALTMGDSARLGGSAMGELAGRLTRNQELGRKIGWVFTANNDMGLAVDTVSRSALWGSVFDDAMRRDIPAWEAEVRRRGAAIPSFEFSVFDAINTPPDFAFDPLKRHLAGLGLQEGVAERLARDFTELRGRNLGEAREKLLKVQFYGDRTNLDEWIANIVPFHYWASRAIRYYGEEAIRHPFLIANYLRANDGIEDALNDPGLSARQKGFIHLFGTALGFSLLMNPEALWGVTKVFGLNDVYDTQGETEMGGVLDWLKQRGLGLYPWLDGTLNLMGMYGNTFEPDLLGIRHKALVGSAINFVRAHAGFDPASAPYADAMGQARYAVSSFVSSFTPDWLSQPVTPRTGGSSQEASLDSIIESVVVEKMRTENPGVTNQEILDVMSDPNSPEYEAAYRTVSEAGIVQQLLNFVGPFRFTMRHDARDVRQAQLDVVAEEAKRLGVAPWELNPTPQDVEFAARYKALTGKDYDAGDYTNAKFDHDLARAPVEAKPLLLAEAGYLELGEPKQRQHFDRYNAILRGETPAASVLSAAGREEMARQYLDRHKVAEDIDAIYSLRDAFETAHPEFAEFKGWQGRMYDLKDQMGGSLAEYRRQASQQNPNAARYFADQEAYFNQNFPNDTTEERIARLDQATASANAFQAITGKGTIRSIPGPFPGVPPADVTLPNLIAPAPEYGAPAGNDWSKQLASLGGPQLVSRI